MNERVSNLQGKLIVSCQALPHEPLHSSFIMGRMAVAAKEGGAAGIRANTKEDIKEIQSQVDLPVIGIVKRDYEGSKVYITPTMKEIDELMEVGPEIIAVDATSDLRPGNITIDQFFGQIKEGARARDFETAIEWLLDCGLISKAYRVQKPAIPLKAYVEFSVFKIFLLDVGLLGAMSDLDAEAILEGSSIFTEFKGALTEQYVHQQLVSDTEYIPYYYSASSHNEIDFIIQCRGQIVPIEIKAEENLRSRSLKAYCDKFHPETAVRTSMAAYREQDWLVNIPLYAVMTI